MSVYGFESCLMLNDEVAHHTCGSGALSKAVNVLNVVNKVCQITKMTHGSSHQPTKNYPVKVGENRT